MEAKPPTGNAGPSNNGKSDPKSKGNGAPEAAVSPYEVVDPMVVQNGGKNVPKQEDSTDSEKKKKTMKMKTVVDRYGIIVEGNVLNGYKAGSIKDHPEHLYQKGSLFYDRRKLMFVSGTREEILKYWTESERKWTRNFTDSITGRQGMVITVADDPSATYDFQRLREFENSLQKLVSATNAIVTTNSQNSMITEVCARMVAKMNMKRKAGDQIPLYGVTSWGNIKWKKDETKEREMFDEDHSRVFIVQKDKEHQEYAVEFVERIFGIEPHTKNGDAVLPRILVVYGGKLETLKKVNGATAFKTPIVLIKNSGGVADLLSDIVLEDQNLKQKQTEAKSVTKSLSYDGRLKSVFGTNDSKEAKGYIRLLQEKAFQKICRVCVVEDLPVCGVKAAFICEKISKLNNTDAVSCDKMCLNIVQNGTDVLAKLLDINTGKRLLSQMTWRGLAYLYLNDVNIWRKSRGSEYKGRHVSDFNYIEDSEVEEIFRRINKDLKHEMSIQGTMYRLPETLDNQPSHRDLFVWYLLSEQIQMAENLWMKSSEMNIKDAFLASFILDGMQSMVYGEKAIQKLTMKSRDFIMNATNMLNEFYNAKGSRHHMPLHRTEATHKSMQRKEFGNKALHYTEVMLRQRHSLYGLLQLAYTHEKSTFVKHSSVRHLLQKKWYGGNTGVKGILIPALILLLLPFLVFALPVFIFFRKSHVEKFIQQWNTSSVKYFFYVVWHIIFILLYMFTLLVDLKASVTANDVILALWIGNLVLEEIRQIYMSDENTWRQKLRHAITLKTITNLASATAFYVGLILKYLPYDLYGPARVILAVVFVIFTLRSLDLFSQSLILGPKLIMIRKMFTHDLAPFLVIMLIFLIAFSVSDYAVLYHNSDFTWTLLEDIFKQGYWMLYGDNGLETFDLEEPLCSYNKDVYSANILPRCPENVGKSVAPYIRAVFILIMFVMILNVLIAMFAGTYATIQEKSYMHWINTFNDLLKETEGRPFLPPPALVFFPVHVLIYFMVWVLIVPFYNCYGSCKDRNTKDRDNKIADDDGNADEGNKKPPHRKRQRAADDSRENQGRQTRCNCYYKKLYEGFDIFVTLYVSSEVNTGLEKQIKQINRFERTVKRMYKERRVDIFCYGSPDIIAHCKSN